ncbi:alpha/beta hydrolase [Agrobacterium rhizogenes]|uniref:alpha/beta hydrolase n=1 Tax=Rhizobium rhizogenes TaxID=359 RepID=UPI0015739CE2|nr:alpha/beta hydrolase [Rhizobium rhizogenes]NTJ26449.1 alpha/beta hydrolase [Rhizobium rhizogenes]
MLTRRSMLAGMSAAAFSRKVQAAPVAATLPLWPAKPPGSGGPSDPMTINAWGAITNIAIPSITVYTPAHPNGDAMLVAAGGGYKRVEEGQGALPAASWLNDRGITAFVLRYRLPGEGWTNGPLAPLQDAQRAIRLIRANVKSFRIDPKRLGVLGFSAGGHLLGLASARSAFASYPAMDTIDALSARPDFAALIYPVITLRPPYDHTSTRRIFVGDHPSPEMSAMWSVDTYVGSDCPPMFLVQAENDPISNPANTLIMQAACERAGVPVELDRLASGGHGFAMGKKGMPSGEWPDLFATWLHKTVRT